MGLEEVSGGKLCTSEVAIDLFQGFPWEMEFHESTPWKCRQKGLSSGLQEAGDF
jgi:hypothetical protein